MGASTEAAPDASRGATRELDEATWSQVMRSVHRASREVKEPGLRREPVYPNWLIVAMCLWAAWHGKSQSWACDRDNYGPLFRPRRRPGSRGAGGGRSLPSPGHFSRRVRSEAVQAILQRVNDDLALRGVRGPLTYVDGMPQTVSPVSKDRDAKRGHVTGGYAKGYKLHAYVNENRRIVVWSVMPLNADEKVVAGAMAPFLPPLPPDALGLGDSNYDSAPLRVGLDARSADPADGCPLPLLTPLRGQQDVGPGGHSPKTMRMMPEQRRQVVRLWERHPGLMEYVLEQRNNVEGTFSVLACVGGLGRLPAHARTLGRVRRWVGAKIILYHARLLAQEKAEDKEAA